MGSHSPPAMDKETEIDVEWEKFAQNGCPDWWLMAKYTSGWLSRNLPYAVFKDRPSVAGSASRSQSSPEVELGQAVQQELGAPQALHPARSYSLEVPSAATAAGPSPMSSAAAEMASSSQAAVAPAPAAVTAAPALAPPQTASAPALTPAPIIAALANSVPITSTAQNSPAGQPAAHAVGCGNPLKGLFACTTTPADRSLDQVA